MFLMLGANKYYIFLATTMSALVKGFTQPDKYMCDFALREISLKLVEWRWGWGEGG